MKKCEECKFDNNGNGSVTCFWCDSKGSEFVEDAEETEVAV